jgi:phospholipase C
VTKQFEPVRTWAFAVKAGSMLEYRWPLQSFEGGLYHLRVYGPNGFFREFIGRADSSVEVSCVPVVKGKKVSGQLKVTVKNSSKRALALRLVEDKYQRQDIALSLKAGANRSATIDTKKSGGWYDFSLRSKDNDEVVVRYAGRLETGAHSISDPYMGKVVPA